METPTDPDAYAPILEGPGESDYERYLRTEELLALQKGPEERAHRDELLFQVVHQSSELWLKLAGFEIEGAVELLRGGERWGAVRLLRRVVLALELITDQLDMLDEMAPWEYHEVRLALGHGSGFDSPGWRRLRDGTTALGEAFAAALEEEGVDLVTLYREGRRHEDLYQVAELLVRVDELAVRWRAVHLLVVQRSSGGGSIGTQGTPVEMLERLVRHRLYPELWEVRNALTALADARREGTPSGGH